MMSLVHIATENPEEACSLGGHREVIMLVSEVHTDLSGLHCYPGTWRYWMQQKAMSGSVVLCKYCSSDGKVFWQPEAKEYYEIIVSTVTYRERFPQCNTPPQYTHYQWSSSPTKLLQFCSGPPLFPPSIKTLLC